MDKCLASRTARPPGTTWGRSRGHGAGPDGLALHRACCPMGFQHCHLSSVYRERSGVSRPKVKDSTVPSHVTGQKGDTTSPWHCWPSEALTMSPEKDGWGRGILWKTVRTGQRGWCHCLLQQMLARPSPNAGSATPPAGPVKCSLPDPSTCVSHRSQKRQRT